MHASLSFGASWKIAFASARPLRSILLEESSNTYYVHHPVYYYSSKLILLASLQKDTPRKSSQKANGDARPNNTSAQATRWPCQVALASNGLASHRSGDPSSQFPGGPGTNNMTPRETRPASREAARDASTTTAHERQRRYSTQTCPPHNIEY